MATRVRRKFTAEFKREAVKLAEQPGRSMTAVAGELGIERSVLKRWIDNFAAADTRRIRRCRLRRRSSRRTQLRRELAKVRMERDILKKALGYFAKDPT